MQRAIGSLQPCLDGMTETFDGKHPCAVEHGERLDEKLVVASVDLQWPGDKLLKLSREDVETHPMGIAIAVDDVPPASTVSSSGRAFNMESS